MAIVPATDLEQRMRLLAYTLRLSVSDAWAHEWTAALVRQCPALSPECELRAFFAAMKARVRYTLHPRSGDRYQTLRRTIEMGVGDCLPATTRLLRDDGTTPEIAEIREGDTIMGDGAWTRVTKTWNKGIRSTLVFHLSNGARLTCTPGHRLFVVPRVTAAGHPATPRNRAGYTSGPREGALEVRAREVMVGDDLLCPESIPLPLAEDASDPDLAWLLGAFVADGWAEADKPGFNISGRDADARKSQAGKRNKEGQKQRVQEIAARYGYETRWAPKSIFVRSPEWLTQMLACGRGAPRKRVPQLRWGRAQTEALLAGLAADAGVSGGSGTLVYSTTSEELARQLRMLWRGMGKGVGIRRVDAHGGFGLNPIYRVIVRGSGESGREGKRYPRVVAIEQGAPTDVVDIETDTHRFWLPDSDVTVHNCDNQTIAMDTMAHIAGFRVGARVYQMKPGGVWDHVAPIVEIPRMGPAGGPKRAFVMELTDGPGAPRGAACPECATFDWQIPWDRVATYRDFWFDLA